MREFSLKRLIEVCVNNIILFFIVGVCAVLVFGGIGFGKGYADYKDSKKNTEYQAKISLENQTYDNDIKSLETIIEDKNAIQENNKDYLNESIYINLDSKKISKMETIFLIDTGYKVMPDSLLQNPDKTEDFIAAYLNCARGQMIYDGIEKIIGYNVKAKYISEICTVTRIESSNFISISVINSNEQTAKKINDLVFNSLTKQVNELMGEHTVTIISRNSLGFEDSRIRERRVEIETQNIALGSEVAQLQAQLDVKLADAPDKKPFTLKIAIKSSLIWAAFGAIMVLAITFITVIISFFYGDKIQSVSDIKNRYGSEVLTVIGMKKQLAKRFSKIKNWTFNKNIYDISEDNALALAASNIFTSLFIKEEAQSVLVSSTFNNEKLQNACTSISLLLEDKKISVKVGGNILNDPVALALTTGCTCFIVAVELGKTTFNEIDLQINKLEKTKKEVIGFLLFK